MKSMRLWPAAGLLAAILFLTGCNLLGAESERVLGSDSPAPLTGGAWVTCSQACRDRGQCGIAQSKNTDVILLNTFQPDVTGHNMILGEGAPVTVLDMVEVPVIKTINFQDTYSARFYLVEVPDRAPAWVGGWCVQQ